MGLKRVSPGPLVPDEINVIIEIPANSKPVKYEIDKDSGTMSVDRFMGTSMRYPCDYGYIPQTLSKDSDPTDVLVICPVPLISGSVVRCRPIGILKMTDEEGPDSKLLAVPVHALTNLYDDVKKPADLSPYLLDKICHFFQHYKDLEKNKWVKIEGWGEIDEAKKEIIESIQSYETYLKKNKTRMNEKIER